ncbi:uroporphyrinogen-III synthase [Methanococcus aeolicus]|uniref:uroporphyrinogen-III synthase n=1 Tax=Methanococcus aeolicus TaxID=42879 RepID=UPI0021C57EC5|nr:uroporphyrinogen-III synthase [Methanococcus aeolicus]UXM85167.1 uroporphyrinogen-III synthase [Methanococcus aeolicus]
MKVIITRPTETGLQFANLLDDDFEPILIPTLELRFKKIDTDLKKYNWIVFTSPRGVMGLYKNKNNIKNFDLTNKKIGVIGIETEKEVKKLFGRDADVIPKKYTAEHLLEELKKHVNEQDKILIPTTPSARDILHKNLNADLEFVYCSEEPSNIAQKLKDLKEIIKYEELKNNKIILTFTSGLTAKNFFKNADSELRELLKNHYIVSIGEITKKTVDSYEEEYNSIIPKKYTINGMVEIIKKLRNKN